MTARLILFGSPTIDYNGESIALPFERRNQLLALLALRRTWVSRADVAAMLWPEQESRLAYTNLRKTLFRLQALPWATGVESQGGALRFEADTDVSAFEAALREGRSDAALALRRGELLAGFDDDASEAWSGWLHFERDRLRLAWRGAALERLAGELEPDAAIAVSASLLDADPLDEAALRAHMTWLARGGQSARARQAYREFVDRLARDLGLAPGAELKALHDSLGATIAAVPRQPLAADSTRNDGFIGRSVELRRIATFFTQERGRLLSITGPGGVGKTRLAQRAIDGLAAAYPDGALFVPLDDLASAAELPGRLARELGLRLAGKRPPFDEVVEHLRGRTMLLVLDNFEHLAADASLIDTMLRGCPRLSMIVTSRVRLSLATEHVLGLEGLPCPEAEDLDRIEAFDAARLFVQAARRVEPALVPSVEAASILDICRQVGGLPLALELAAAWTRVLSCDAIAAELRQGTELLHAADSAHPPRHASIDVVFEQSWRLLSAAERDALSRLSVFRGGFSTEAARAIAGASLPVLAALADKSLLRKDNARIHMHPLVQQMAALRLDDGDARGATERAHATYFHRVLAESRHRVEDADGDALQWLETEFENCRNAWTWAVANGGIDALAGSALTLLHFCDHRGRLEEGLALLRNASESPAAAANPSARALLLAASAHLEYRLDRYTDAEATATRALAASRSTRDRATRLQAFKVLGGCCLRLGRHGDARRFFRQALEQAPAEIDPRNAAALLDNLALVEKVTGNYDEAHRLSLQSLMQHRRLGDAAGVALCLNNLGSMYIDRREYEAAVGYLREGLAICERRGLVTTRGLVLTNLAEWASKTGDDESAGTYARKALELAESAGNRSLVCWLKLLSVRFALRQRDFPLARSHLAAGMDIALSINRAAMQLSAVGCFADIVEAEGDASSARLILRFAADHPSTGGMERTEILRRLGEGRPAGEHGPGLGLGLDELANRIVVEADIGHAPLLALLRGAR